VAVGKLALGGEGNDMIHAAQIILIVITGYLMIVGARAIGDPGRRYGKR
jgi:hypothetical protein